MSTTFVSQVNGSDLYAKRAERTRSGLNLETFNDGTSDVPGILPEGVGTSGNAVLATKQYVLDQIGGVAGAMIFKDVVNGTTKVLPTTGYKAGWVYEVSVAGTYAGETCEVGDMIICVKDFDTTASNSDWAVIQKNLDGIVIGPASAVDERIAVFDGTSGKLLKDGGKKISDLALENHVHGNITNDGKIGDTADLAVVTSTGGAVATADLTTAAPTVPSEGTTEALAFIDSVSQDSKGKITATKKNVKIASTYSGTGTDPVNGTAVKAAIDSLDAEVTSNDGTNVQVKVTEVDGKITGVSVTTDNTQAKVSSATAGNFAGLDSNGQVTDSGSKASDFATAAQGSKADSAIQSVKMYGAAAALTPDANKEVTIPVADSSNYGVVTIGTVSL